MANTYLTINMDPADATNTARQLQAAQLYAMRINREAYHAIYQTAPLQTVYVTCGTQTVTAATANASFKPISAAGVLVQQI